MKSNFFQLGFLKICTYENIGTVLFCKKQVKLKIKQSKLTNTFFKKLNSSVSSKMCDKKSGDQDKNKEPKKAVKDTKSNDESSSPTLKTRPYLVDTDNNTKG